METDEKYVQIPEAYSRRKLNALYRKIPLKDTTIANTVPAPGGGGNKKNEK